MRKEKEIWKMTPTQSVILREAWIAQDRLLREILHLADVNPSLAYGLIRTAETMIDMVLRDRIGNGPATQQVKEKEKGADPS